MAVTTAQYTLDIPIADVSAGQLYLRHNAPAPTRLKTLALHSSATGSSLAGLQLAVIGASHVVDVVNPAGQIVFREELSCTAIEGGQLVGQGLTRHRRLPGWHVEATAVDWQTDIQALRPTQVDFDRYAQWLLSQSGKEWLVCRFPGEGDFHLTALRGQLGAQGARWQTWHLYPAEGAIVHSRSQVVECDNVTDTMTAPSVPAGELGGRDV